MPVGIRFSFLEQAYNVRYGTIKDASSVTAISSAIPMAI